MTNRAGIFYQRPDGRIFPVRRGTGFSQPNNRFDGNYLFCAIYRQFAIIPGWPLYRRRVKSHNRRTRAVSCRITESNKCYSSNWDFCRNIGVIHVYHSNWIDRLVALEAGGHYHLPGRGHYLYRNLGREKYDF